MIKKDRQNLLTERPDETLGQKMLEHYFFICVVLCAWLVLTGAFLLLLNLLLNR